MGCSRKIILIKNYNSPKVIGTLQVHQVPPLVLLDQYHSTYRWYDWQDKVNCLPIPRKYHWANQIETLMYTGFLIGPYKLIIYYSLVILIVSRVILLEHFIWLLILFDQVDNIYIYVIIYWYAQVYCLIFLNQFKNFSSLQVIWLAWYIWLSYYLLVIPLDTFNPHFILT